VGEGKGKVMSELNHAAEVGGRLGCAEEGIDWGWGSKSRELDCVDFAAAGAQPLTGPAAAADGREESVSFSRHPKVDFLNLTPVLIIITISTTVQQEDAVIGSVNN
jgi:hypothetical protein